MMKAVGVQRMNKVKGNSKTKAFVDVLFSLRDDGDAVFSINGCKLIEGAKGLFVAMPSQSYEKDGETKWSSYVFINLKEDQDARDLQNSINEVVIAEWNKQNSSSKKAPKTEGSFEDDDLDW